MTTSEKFKVAKNCWGMGAWEHWSMGRSQALPCTPVQLLQARMPFLAKGPQVHYDVKLCLGVFKNIKIDFVFGYFAYTSVYHFGAEYLQRPDVGTESPRTGPTDSCELPCRVWKSNRILQKSRQCS